MTRVLDKIYLDNNAATPLDAQVLDAMLPFFREDYGNASSLHSFGRSARKAVEKARADVALFIGAAFPEEIVFTSGGTEADNLALAGVLGASKDKRRHIITSQIEHRAILNTCEFLEQNDAAKVTYLPVDRYGAVDIDGLRKAIKEETALISIMYANNEVGTLEPVGPAAEIAGENGIIFHTDAVQAAGKIALDVRKERVDLASLSAHKIYGPKGVGALYIKKGVNIKPIMHGGHQEKGMRSGTENVAGIAGFGKACQIARKRLNEDMSHMAKLSDKLLEFITSRIDGAVLNGHPAERLINTLNVGFRGIDSESLIMNLDLCGIAASSGSACASGSMDPSHVLKAMGVEPSVAAGSLRFSLGRHNTAGDIERTCDVLLDTVRRLRDLRFSSGRPVPSRTVK